MRAILSAFGNPLDYRVEFSDHWPKERPGSKHGNKEQHGLILFKHVGEATWEHTGFFTQVCCDTIKSQHKSVLRAHCSNKAAVTPSLSHKFCYLYTCEVIPDAALPEVTYYGWVSPLPLSSSLQRGCRLPSLWELNVFPVDSRVDWASGTTHICGHFSNFLWWICL